MRDLVQQQCPEKAHDETNEKSKHYVRIDHSALVIAYHETPRPSGAHVDGFGNGGCDVLKHLAASARAMTAQSFSSGFTFWCDMAHRFAGADFTRRIVYLFLRCFFFYSHGNLIDVMFNFA
jgi:hypothetical protein